MARPAAPQTPPPHVKVLLCRGLRTVVKPKAQFTQWRPQRRPPERPPQVVLGIFPRVFLQAKQQVSQLARPEASGVDEGLVWQEGGVIGTSQHHGHQAVHQRPPHFLRHVGVTQGVLKGQVEEVPDAKHLPPTAVVAVLLPSAAPEGREWHKTKS